MEKSQQFNPNSVTINWSASVIEKVHKCEDCPIEEISTETTTVILRPNPRLACHMVAWLESPSGEEMRLPGNGKCSSIKILIKIKQHILEEKWKIYSSQTQILARSHGAQSLSCGVSQR